MARIVRSHSCRKPNALALVVTTAATLLLYASFDPVPAGEDLRADVAGPPAVAPDFNEVPIPPEMRSRPAAEGETDAAVTESDAAVPAPPSGGCQLSNLEAIRFSLLLLNDGARFLANSPSYTTTFTKQERINGDLSEDQIIEMKVRHDPCFSVYMKWRNGDTGRQVLYSDAYEDGQMVVKLGGFKGRLLPAIKLDPNGERATSESRYPITQAGILGMLRQIQQVREEDLKQGYGVTCRRLPNREFDQRDCYCFEYMYDSPERSPIYRRSIIMIDARYHIPLFARNYTWAVESEGLTAEELDERTLVESYSFSNIDFSRELVANDFSRDNPRYRM